MLKVKFKSTPLSLNSKIYRLHIDFVRRVNNIYIFVNESIPLLKKGRGNYAASSLKDDLRYTVPAIGKSKIAIRKKSELDNVFDSFLDRELFENLLVAAVSHCESFICDVLRVVLTSYPAKLTLSLKGLETPKVIPLQLLIQATDRNAALAEIIESQITAVLYASPKTYLQYLKHVAGIETQDSVFLDYIEIKAARDLIIHNNGLINAVYMLKAGKQKRGGLGDKINVNALYFNHCIASLKQLSAIVQRDIAATFA